MFNDQICEGMKVRAAEGASVGKVISADETGFVVEKGIFFKKDYYVSFDAVTEIRDDEIYLSTSKAELQASGSFFDESQPRGIEEPRSDMFAKEPTDRVAGVDFGDRDVLGARDEFGSSPDSVEPVGTRPTPSVPDDVDLELERTQTADATAPTEPDGQAITDDDDKRIPQ